MIFKPRKTTTESSSESTETTSRQIDADLEKRAEENYVRALLAAGMRTQPYTAPVVADFTDQQYAAMRSTNMGARTMGIDAPKRLQRPSTETVGGIRGMTMEPVRRVANAGISDQHASDVNEFYKKLTQSLNRASNTGNPGQKGAANG